LGYPSIALGEDVKVRVPPLGILAEFALQEPHPARDESLPPFGLSELFEAPE
jgi:hypothetical protein